MNIEFDNNVPIYLQLVDRLKIYIISGKILPGERLLSVRDLAFQMKVNPNTMQKALVELENIGLIYTERTNGKFITNDVELINKIKSEYALEITNEYLQKIKSIGLDEKQAIEFLERIGEND